MPLKIFKLSLLSVLFISMGCGHSQGAQSEDSFPAYEETGSAALNPVDGAQEGPESGHEITFIGTTGFEQQNRPPHRGEPCDPSTGSPCDSGDSCRIMVLVTWNSEKQTVEYSPKMNPYCDRLPECPVKEGWNQEPWKTILIELKNGTKKSVLCFRPQQLVA